MFRRCSDQSGYPYDFVEEAATLGIVKGYGNGAFGPYDSITRAQLVLMIIRGAAAAGSSLPAYTGSRQVFADVPVSHRYYDEIMTAWAAGILNGSSGGDGRLYFRPYSPASRNHVAKMTRNFWTTWTLLRTWPRWLPVSDVARAGRRR
jgi:hypothetical protein